MSFDVWIKVLTLLVATSSVLTFFYGEYSADQRDIQSHTADVIERYRSGDVFEAQMRLIETWKTLPVKRIADTSASQVVIDRLVSGVVASNDDFFRNFMTMVNYFDSIFMCIQIGECDTEMAVLALKSDAIRFNLLYHGAIFSTRERLLLHNLGNGLEAFVSLTSELGRLDPTPETSE